MIRRHHEHWFYLGYATLVFSAVVLGFARTFFLRPWYPEWVAAHSPPEPFFLLHGAAYTAWFIVLLVQVTLITTDRAALHKYLGWAGLTLAAAMVPLGVVATVMAARRPSGFVDVPAPPLDFMIVPLSLVVLFAVFVALAVASRRDGQQHKRWMMLASVSLIEAGVGRWPWDFVRTGTLFPFLTPIALIVDLFLVPLVVWDLWTRRRVHPVTVAGGLALVLLHPLRPILAQTSAWQEFATWLTQR